MTTITALPTPPTRQDPDNFADRADTFLSALPTFVTQTNALAGELNSASVAAINAETSANNAAASAVAAANFKGSWASLTGALNVPAAVFHDGAIWLLLVNLANVAASEPSVTNTNWLDITQSKLTGAVEFFATRSAPEGWLKANGAAISRSTYQKLFNTIGTTWGAGDGSTTFNLPDLRGEFLRGWDDGRGVDSGRVFGSSQSSQNLSHNHTGTVDSGGTHNHQIWGNNSDIAGRHRLGTTNSTATLWDGNYTQDAGAHNHTFTSNLSGGTEARPRNVALLACIKY